MKAYFLHFFLLTALFTSLVYSPQRAPGVIQTAHAARPQVPSPLTPSSHHNGTITTDQTWYAADNPHILDDEVTVAAGVTLTIEPGAIVQGTLYSGMYILGSLQAVGTPDHPILFTSDSDSGAAQWRGLGFDGPQASGRLRYVTVRFGGLYHSEVGSYAEVAARNVGLGRLIVEDSTITAASFWTSGNVYGITVDNSLFTMARSTVSGIGGASDDGAMRITGAATQATITDSTFTGNAGTTLIVSGGASAVIAENDFHGNWLAIQVEGDSVWVENNRIHDNNAPYSTSGGIHINGGSPVVRGNVITNNSGGGNGTVSVSGTGSPLLVNNVIIDNQTTYRCAAILISAPATPVFKYNTVAGNTSGDSSNICLYGQYAQAQFFNTIIADQAVGVTLDWDSSSVEMNNTLWDNVPTRSDGEGVLVNNLPFYGRAAFDLDGYHLTRQSAAIGKGAAVGVSVDIDNEARPLPAGTLPDLGADEFAGDQAPSFWVEFYSEPPRLEARSSGGVRILQEFYIYWNYGSDEDDPPDLPLVITSTLGSAMQYETYEAAGAGNFSFQRDGQTLTWTAQQAVEKDDYGVVHTSIAYDSTAQPGVIVDNTVHVSAGANTFSQTVSTEIPHFPPKITWPIDGEMCSAQFVNMEVHGYAIPGSVVRLYEDGVERGFTLANDEDGLFIFTYSSPQAGIDNYTQLTVKSCNPLNPYDCSQPSNTVTITRQNSFWCPRRSTWEGSFETVHGDHNTYHLRYGFRDNAGKTATEGWSFFAGTGLKDSTLTLYLCICPGMADLPSDVHVIANGTTYHPTGGTPTIPLFSIPAASGAIEFHGTCGATEIVNHGTILIDPDGFVFDITQGFDPANPAAQHVLPGATVTLMVDEPLLGGWVRWPAQLYADQVNPQVTGADGYYAFYTPPGRYYVQVSGKDGFQGWRSPVISVVDELVHMNVPLTPITGPASRTQNLSVSNPEVPVIFLHPGETLEWQAEVQPDLSVASRQAYTQNPVIRALSGLDPQMNTLGWDSGMLIPGATYRRQFSQAGGYTYTDGLGNSTQVVVGETLFIPILIR
jgi:hypothetical protein